MFCAGWVILAQSFTYFFSIIIKFALYDFKLSFGSPKSYNSAFLFSSAFFFWLSKYSLGGIF